MAKGSFRLDRRRAFEKLSHHQLEDPHRYTLELVAAAVCAGATKITVVNDSDDFEIEWDGDHPTAEELEALLDWIFTRSDDRRARMLQHLSQGLFGAVGLDPRWVHLERPGVKLTLTDPLEPIQAPSPRTEGVRVHVRERFSWKVLREGLSRPFDAVYETKLLRRYAWCCPVPIVLNGKALPSAREAWPTPSDRPVRVQEGQRLWLEGPDESLAAPEALTGVALIRDGVVVGQAAVNRGPLRLRGAKLADALRLNASRSAPIEDEVYKQVLGELVTVAASLVEEHLAGREGADLPEPLRAAALDLIARGEGKNLLGLKLIRDLLDRWFSVEDVIKLGRVALVEAELSPASEIHWPQLPEEKKKDDGEEPMILALTRAALKAQSGLTMRRETALLKQHAQGRERRERLAREGEGLRFAARHLKAIPDVGVEGWVGVGPTRPARFKHPKLGLTIELRVDGLPVELVVEDDMPGPLVATVQAQGMRADATFEKVTRDEHTQRALRAARAAARTLLAEVVSNPNDPDRHALAEAWLTQITDRLAADTPRRQLRQRIPAEALTTLTFGTLDGGARTLGDIVDQAARESAEPVRFLRRGTTPPSVAPGVLLLEEGEVKALRHALRDRLEDATRALLEESEARRRRAAPKESPRLPKDAEAVTPITLASLRGELGLSPAVQPARALVLREGVNLAVVDLPDGPPCGLASVEWDGAQPNRAWSGLESVSAASAALATLLNPALRALVQQAAEGYVAQQAPDRRPPLPRYLFAALCHDRVARPALMALPLFRDAAGSLHSADDLRRWREAHRDARIPWVSLPVEPGVPLPDGLMVLDEDRVEALLACLGKASTLDVTERLRAVRAARLSFYARPVEPERLGRGQHLNPAAVSGEGWEGELALVLGADAPAGLDVRALHEGRLLKRVTWPFPAPYVAVVRGPALAPNETMDGFHDEAATVKAWRALTEASLARLLVDLQAGGLTVGQKRAVLTRLHDANATQSLPPTQREAARDALADAPLFDAIGHGAVSLRAAREALRLGQLRVVPPGVTLDDPPEDRLFLRVAREDEEGLRHVLGRLPPEGVTEIDQILSGRRRWQVLGVEPLVPAAAQVAAAITHHENKVSIWAAIPLDRQKGLRVEWRVGGRTLLTEDRPCDTGVRLRVEHPELTPDDAFSAPRPGPAKDAVEDLIPFVIHTLMHRVAQARSPKEHHHEGEPLALHDAQEAGLALLAWAATGAVGKDWDRLPLIATAEEGRWLTVAQLKAVARRGALRVVQPHQRGGTGDPDRPAIPADATTADALAFWGVTDDYGAQLELDARLVAHLSAPPSRPTPETGPDVLLTVPIHGGGREGFVQVRRDGASGLRLYKDWRPLGELDAPGPIPVVGALSSPTLTADKTTLTAVADAHLSAALNAVQDLTQKQLAALIDRLDPSPDRGLILRLLARNLNHPSKLGSAKGKLGRLVTLPVFATGDGKTLSARDVGKLKERRWVSLGVVCRSEDADRPFIQLSEVERALLQPLLPGRDAEAEAPAEHRRAEERRRVAEALTARAQPFELPADVEPLAVASFENKRLRALAAIHAELGPSRVELRVKGATITGADESTPGVVAILDLKEMPPGGVVTALPELLKALATLKESLARDCVTRLVAESAPRERLCGLLRAAAPRPFDAEKLPQGARFYFDLPLLPTPKSPISLTQAAKAQAGRGLLFGDKDLGKGKPLVLLDSPESRALVSAVGLEVAEPAVWTQRERAVQRERALKDTLRRRRRAVVDATTRLTAGLTATRGLTRRVEAALNADEATLNALGEAPTRRQVHALAYALVEAVMLQQLSADEGKADELAEVLVRAAERCSGAGDAGGDDPSDALPDLDVGADA
ncbi:MAG: hypothetical protein IPI35_17005 [Deltaproteobacteria bacterium]|nr:hypothetical protein [Deltaproteobacteria bacterium]